MNWYKILKLADYEAYQQQIEEISAQNPYPFKDWFDTSGRAYLPFQSQTQALQQGIEPEVAELLSYHGCEITDYQGGYCQIGNRTQRIGKFLQNIRRQVERDLKQKYENGEIYDLERDMQEEMQFIDDVTTQFINSPARSSKAIGQLSIAISQNPHDVGAMSTDRNWTSCMELGEGSHHESVFCEVASGGLVAYLIDANDTNIQNPLSRIHIRRFENRYGESIALPEQSVYGQEIPGFYDEVNAWLLQRQPNMQPGMYQRKGGDYSDTFDDEQMVGPINQEGVLKWLRGEDREAEYVVYEVNDEFYYDLKAMEQYEFAEDIENQGGSFRSKEEAMKHLELYSHNEQSDYERERAQHLPDMEDWNSFDEEEGEWERERLVYNERKIDNKLDMQRYAIKEIINSKKGEYPQEILEEVRDIVFNSNRSISSNLQREFIKKHPELLAQDQISGMTDQDNMAFIESLPEDKREPYLKEWRENIAAVLADPAGHIIDTKIQELQQRMQSIADINSRVRGQETIGMYVRNNVHDYLIKPLEIAYDQLPEPIIQQLINFVNNSEVIGITDSDIESPGRPGGRDDYTSLALDIAHLLNKKKADTPSVQRFYEQLLTKWEDPNAAGYSNFGPSNIGWYIKNLGENGKNFLPFFKNKLAQEQAALEQLQTDPKSEHLIPAKQKTIEQYLNSIDSITNGTGTSKKYRYR